MQNGQLLSSVRSFCLILIIIALPFKTAYAKGDSNPQEVYKLTLNDNIIWKQAGISGSPEKPGPFIRMVTERSGGRIKIDLKRDQFPITESLHACMDGRIDMTTAAPSYYTGTVPVWSFGSLPFLIQNMDEYRVIMNDPRTRKILDRLYRKAGVIYIAGTHAGEQDVVGASKQIATVEEFKGKKIRAYGDLQIRSLTLLGASAISISYAELPTALSLGTVDGFMSGLTGTIIFRSYKMAPYINRWPINNAWTLDLWINAKKFNSLPKDLQKILLDVGKEVEETMYYGAWREDSACETVIASKDLKKVTEVIPAPAEIESAKKITAPVWDQWTEKHGADAKELLEAIKKVLADCRGKK